MEKLIEKYSAQVPRYTSYPAVPYWNKMVNDFKWLESLKSELTKTDEVDLYFHIPYCQKLCWYCGCNRVITKDNNKAWPYLDALKKEWQHITQHLGDLNDFKINSIHFGGGTPNFLTLEQLDYLLSSFKDKITTKTIFQVELDPRTLTSEHYEFLKKYNIKRVSLGIQDFDLDVQTAINRIQSFELVKSCVEKFRLIGVESINFDLICGLPKQTTRTIKETIKQCLSLNPDQISFYSYAHLPHLLANQKLIKECDLPDLKTKRAIYEQGKELLCNNGFFEIGLDHFAKESSYLYQSYLDKKMKRSFMGHTDKKSDVLIGLGASSISNTSNIYKQNTKDIYEYINQAESGEYIFTTGHDFSSEDQFINFIIQELMSQFEIPISVIQKLNHYQEIEVKLNQFFEDDLLRVDEKMLKVTETGRIFIRNICASIDPYFQGGNTKNFSKNI